MYRKIEKIKKKKDTVERDWEQRKERDERGRGHTDTK